MIRIFIGDDFHLNDRINGEKVWFYHKNGNVYLESDLSQEETLKELENILQEEIKVDEDGYILQSGRKTTARFVED